MPEPKDRGSVLVILPGGQWVRGHMTEVMVHAKAGDKTKATVTFVITGGLEKLNEFVEAHDSGR